MIDDMDSMFDQMRSEQGKVKFAYFGVPLEQFTHEQLRLIIGSMIREHEIELENKRRRSAHMVSVMGRQR
jgi:hypothetical protein